MRLGLLINGIPYLANEECGLHLLQFEALKGSLITVPLEAKHD